MTSSREQTVHNQLPCWNCEEIVHVSASSCPYCNAALHHAKTSVPASTHIPTSNSKNTNSKITQLIPTQAPLAPHDLNEPHPIPKTGPAILSLFLLLAGCNILFLGILIALFSRDGSFSLQWAEQHWPAYFGLGIALTAFGLFTLRQVEK